jgi:3-oxoacyl-[acyl-carrier protein] reductase
VSKLFVDRVAVVTGAGRGIGKEIARRLVQGGAKVAVVSRNVESCNAAAEGLNREHPGLAHAYALDVADWDQVVVVCKQIVAELGVVSILVNNAGVTRDNITMRMSADDWDTVLDTNLKGSFHMVKALQLSLMRQSGGRIVNISSVTGLMGKAGQANYASSKAGMIGLTKSLAREFAGRKVTVNAVAPGFITTDMTEGLSDDVKAKILETVPLGEFGTVEDVAAAVEFILSPGARYITGQVLTVDGGMVM